MTEENATPEQTLQDHPSESSAERSCATCDVLKAQISALIEQTKDINVSNELSYVLKVLPELHKKSDSVLVDLARMSISALSANPPSLELAKVLNKEIKKKLSLVANIAEMLKSSKSSSNYVLLGLGIFLYLGIPIAASVFQYVTSNKYDQILGIDLYTFFIIFVFGSLGSIVSILSRIKDYSISTEKDISNLFYTGLFKPIIGSAFALFVYSLVKGKLLPIAITKDTEIFIYISLSFLSGFSERFTNDVIGKAETVASKPG